MKTSIESIFKNVHPNNLGSFYDFCKLRGFMFVSEHEAIKQFREWLKFN